MNEGDWIIEMPRGIPKMIQCMIEGKRTQTKFEVELNTEILNNCQARTTKIMKGIVRKRVNMNKLTRYRFTW